MGDIMEKTIDVLVIGTEPPCPRCDLVTQLITESANSIGHIKFRHCTFDSAEAQEFGRKKKYKIGTAKHVSEAGDIDIDWDAVHEVIDDEKIQNKLSYRAADLWTPELDKLLEPCQRVAESVSYYMTPIIVINGNVKHHGSVPSRDQIEHWLKEE
jgi:hypothetical protein